MAESAAYARRGYKGGAKASTVPAGVASGASSLVGQDLSTWVNVAANGPFTFVLDPGLATEEVCEATALSGNNITGITRGLRGTSAVAHDPNCAIKHVSSDRDFDEANRLVNAILGISGLTAGDLLYLLSATTFARLAKGTARQQLAMNPGATAPEWVASLQSLLTAAGDILYASSANTPARLAKGTDGQVLTLASGLPAWAAATTSSFVGAKVFRSADKSILDSTWTAIDFDSETFDTDGIHSTVSNTTRLTIPTGKDGKWLFFGQGAFAANGTGIRQATFYKNGVDVNQELSAVPAISGGASTYFPALAVLSLAAADYIEMFVWQNSGGALNARANTSLVSAIYLGA